MTSLQGRYERVPGVDGRKEHCGVPRERNCIRWTPEMESACVQVKEALSAECELYMPSPDDEYRIHVDACDHGVGAVLEQHNPDSGWKPCTFLSCRLEGKDGEGQTAWSTREQETYALVSSLLKFKVRLEDERSPCTPTTSLWRVGTRKIFVPSRGVWQGVAGGMNFEAGTT